MEAAKVTDPDPSLITVTGCPEAVPACRIIPCYGSAVRHPGAGNACGDDREAVSEDLLIERLREAHQQRIIERRGLVGVAPRGVPADEVIRGGAS